MTLKIIIRRIIVLTIAALFSTTVSSTSTTATATAFVGRTASCTNTHRPHAKVGRHHPQQHGGSGFLLATTLTDTTTLSNLAKEWSALNSDHHNGMTTAAFKTSSVATTTAPMVAVKTNNEAAMDELSRAWAALNQDTDAIQYPNIKKKETAAGLQLHAPAAAAPTSSFVAAPPALAAPRQNQQPTMSDSYSRLAKEWAAINKDTDTMKPTPPIVTSALLALPAAATQPTYPPPLVASLSSLSITSETAHSLVQAAKDKWEEMAAELAEINQEAEQTFAALNAMEQEMNDMIQKMQLREADYQERYIALQQSSAQRQDELLTKMQSMAQEYENFKRDALMAQQASAQQAAAAQSQLQNQITQLQHDLQIKVQLLQQESSKAQYYMNKYQELEHELSKTKHEFEQERISMQKEQIISTQGRIQMLRSVNANLRHLSNGSREIMKRMRIKMQCLEGI